MAPRARTHEVAASVDELVAGASLREPMQSTDSKSGARFERVVIDGERFVLKHVDTSRDWLMRDESEWLVPADDSPLPLEQHLRFLEHLATFHAACWGWDDTLGLLPLTNRYSLFGPDAIACEAALGFPEPVPRIARVGWERQLRLCLLGVMLQLGWEKAFDETGVELAWWDARVHEGIAELERS